EPLSSLVEKKTGSHQVLYNWNTAGSAVLVANTSGKVLTTRQTGALPVTFGAETSDRLRMETGLLLKQENEAYNYFAGRQDANLERVVQYTIIYQLCRAVMQAAPNATPPVQELTPGIRAGREAAAVRVKATAALLGDLDSGTVRITDPKLTDV